MSSLRVSAILAPVAVLTGLLVACSATPVAHPSPTSTETARAVPGLPPGVTPAESIPTSVPDEAQARRNVELDRCEMVDGGWEAAGEARNPGKNPVTYTITVFFTTATATVIATATATATVEAGEKASWKAVQKFTAPSQTLCVLRGVA